MQSATTLTCGGRSLATIAVLVCWFSAFPTLANAQGTQGQNAVCSSVTGCLTQAGSSAFISVLWTRTWV
jgi:hypothetical protein